MPSISETLQTAADILEKSGIAQPRREAGSLLAFALQKNKTFLIAHSEYHLSAEEQLKFYALVHRRSGREPFQYITENQEFFGLDFMVTPDVLIPRPETELLVETALEILKNTENPRFCEIGVGSGCISVSILHELKNAEATAADISPKALRIAAKNAERHHAAARLHLVMSDVFAELEAAKYDLIVSNPPYIAKAEVSELQPEVRDFEPLNALTDGGSGFSIIEKIVLEAPNFLKPKGFLLLEIGFGQARQTMEIFDGRIWEETEILLDLQGIPRTVRARLKV